MNNDFYQIKGHANATYSGVYGSVMNDEFDQASQAFQHNLQRSDLFDFSVDVVHIRSHYMMDVGRAGRPDWTLYIRPFHIDTWLVTAAVNDTVPDVILLLVIFAAYDFVIFIVATIAFQVSC